MEDRLSRLGDRNRDVVNQLHDHMDRTHIELLDGFLADPADPRWSSSAMDRMFASVEGDAKQKLLKVIQPVDDRLVDSCSDLTREQTEFLS